MKKVKLIKKGGFLEPETEVKDLGFGLKYNGDEVLIFETVKEQENNTKKTDEETFFELKESKLKEFDYNTQKLIFEGFEFGNERFSLSNFAQINWSNLKNIDNKHFPLHLSTVDDKKFLLEFEDVNSFYDKYIETVNGHLKSGIILKEQVKLATIVGELKNIEDKRR